MKSSIYRGQVSHSRKTPLRHGFRYDVFMMYLDLAELDDVFRGRWFGVRRLPVFVEKITSATRPNR